MARVNSRSSFFPCSETKQKSLLRRLMRHEMHNYRLPSSDGGLYGVSSQIMTIGINYGHYMVTIFYWAARQGNAQSRNTSCSCRKKTKWSERNFQKTVHVPLSLGPIFAGRGRLISGRLANRLGSRFGTNTKLFCGVIGPIFLATPNYYLNTVFDGVISLRGSCRNNALPRFPREKL